MQTNAQSGYDVDFYAADTNECAEMCASCPEPQCAPGVSLVPDNGPCNCCKKCALQYNQVCDLESKCDSHLYCSYPDIDSVEGKCMCKYLTISASLKVN